MDRDRKQVRTVKKGLTFVLRAKSFREGYEEALRGLPLDPDRYGGRGDDCWQYERGRQFAFWFQGKLKNGNRLSRIALYELNRAVAAKAVI